MDRQRKKTDHSTSYTISVSPGIAFIKGAAFSITKQATIGSKPLADANTSVARSHFIIGDCLRVRILQLTS